MADKRGKKGFSIEKTLDFYFGKKYPGTTISKVKLYTRKKRLDIFLKVPNLVDAGDINDAGNSLSGNLDFIEDLRIFQEYPSTDEIWLSQNWDGIWQDIKRNLVKEIPSCRRWIEDCGVSYNDGTLLITFNNPMVYQLFRTNNVEKHLQKPLKSFRKNGLNIESILDTENLKDRITKHEDQKKQEESSFIRAATKNINPQKGNYKDNNGTHGKNPIIMGRSFKGNPEPIDKLREDSGRVIVKGKIFDKEVRETRNGKIILSIDITDYTSSITLKTFCEKEEGNRLGKLIEKGNWIWARGECQYDRYQRDVIVIIRDLMWAYETERKDEAPVKRAELHVHSQMSAMDGVSPVESLIARAAQWGHPAIAITDHGVLQAFPEAFKAGKKHGIKIIYGLEAYLVDDCKVIVSQANDKGLDQPMVVLDIETTGLDFKGDAITEIGAAKISDGKIIDTYETLVNPERSIPAKITQLTGIDNDMVKNAPSIKEALSDFRVFCGDLPLVAHNASFDLEFIKREAKPIGWDLKNPIIDTLSLSRELIRDIKRHRLDQLAKYFKIPLNKHHRALDDAIATSKIMIELIKMLKSMDIKLLNDINSAFNRMTNINALPTNHAVILVKNNKGLKNLYRLVSESHLNYFYRRPRIPKSLLLEHREGLLIGSGCEAGELYRAMVKGSSYKKIKEIGQFYDFLEIQPLKNNEYLVRDGHVEDWEAIKKINRSIVKLGNRLNRPVVATGDVHFLEPEDEYFRRILMNGQGFKDADNQAPLYFKTTSEMLDDFSYLGKAEAIDVVVHATRAIVDMIGDVQPIPNGLFTPEIPGAEEDVRSMAMKKAFEIYGKPLPIEVEERLEKEIHSITKHGFAVLYLIAHKLVNKSLADGYLVGSRGSVGSSLAAYMTDITEVNPLPPHYICPKCKYSDFNIDKSIFALGVDLPPKDCPNCETICRSDGFDIPFEVFLGFKGDKVPDIDLNFSGEYQPRAHKYTEELFGEGHVFRAGTIGTIAEKTAYGFVKKYLDEKDIIVTNTEIKRLVSGCTGVKRTTGQHPGGVMVVPNNREIYEFTPIQHPADAKNSGVITTHFDYNFIHDNLVKLDILGHDDPTMIKMLEDITGMDAKKIPLNEQDTMAIFSGTESLGLTAKDIGSPVGTFGIPEFGTRFVRQMLMDTKPTTFDELVRISGLSHGTDVWLNNAQDLVRGGIAKLSEVISTRDDIMIYLIYKGLESTMAFDIMENVRRGRGLTPEWEKAMIAKDIPNWFIESCKKIKYMFPKAHAAAYVIMAFRIAYFKVHHPKAFYASYFTVKSGDFDADFALGDVGLIKSEIKELEAKGNNLPQKERSLLVILEVVLEMYLRGIKFLPIDLYDSSPTRFLIRQEGILPPLNTLQGVGTNAAYSIDKARQEGKFLSIEDLRERTKITKTSIEVLRRHGALEGLSETNQLSLFG